jgi:predicted nuclease with RNAse H fold
MTNITVLGRRRASLPNVFRNRGFRITELMCRAISLRLLPSLLPQMVKRV